MLTAPVTLIRDFLEWLEVRPRTYAEAMDVWRTSCPRLTVWEDALEDRLILRRAAEGTTPVVVLTSAGRRWLQGEQAHGRTSPDTAIWS
jgi:hypothetical protein